ncbi:MAG: hypothetical protein ACYDHP_08215 [Ferrimicrobium sp.]
MTQAARAMSEEHKRALSEGRAQSKAINEYLRFLEESRPKRGRRRDASRVSEQLLAVESKLQEARGLQKVELLQLRADLQEEMARLESTGDRVTLENEFARHAKAYSERKGIRYRTWVRFGVPTDLLERAGVTE